ncbi:MAG: DUF6151 family protein [Porticoccaceae bacterium]|nr:DUF6151 family protein [Porticoccaceae bacterium]
MSELSLSCQCGEVQGTARDVSAKTGNHLVCYCHHCQRFMKELGQEALLDDNGGSYIFQMPSCNLIIHKGHDQLRCLKLTPKGPLRWHTACCNSPIANTFSPGMPLVGILTSFIAAEADRTNLGKVRFYVQGQNAIGKPPHPVVHPKFPGKLIRRILRQALWGKLQGRQKPNPFFSDEGKPVYKPRKLHQ